MALAVRVPVHSVAFSDSVQGPPDSTAVPQSTPASPSLDSLNVANTSTPSTTAEPPLSTTFTLAGGGGRDYREVLIPLGAECSGVPPATFKEEYVDAGAAFDRQMNRLLHLGIRGGVVHEETEFVGAIDTVIVGLETSGDRDIYYANPYFGFEWNHVGVGAGVLISSRELNVNDDEDTPFEEDGDIYPTAHLRFGRLSKLYVSGHLFEGVPVYSGGGLFVGGVGFRPIGSLELYGAYCASGPYEDDGLLGRVTLDINQSWTLMSTVRFPTKFSNESGNFDDKEYGVSIGASYRMTR